MKQAICVMTKFENVIILSWFFISFNAYAAIIHIPGDYPDFAQAIEAASNGDEILVADGVYTGSANRGITITKNLTIQSESGPDNCVLDAQESDRFFHISSGFSVAFEGLTFRHGYVDQSYAVWGGAIESEGSLSVNRCIFSNNRLRCRGDEHDSAYGSAISHASNQSGIVANSVFFSNYCDSDVYWAGALMGADYVANCTFYQNSGYSGGYFDGSALYGCDEVINCIIFDNAEPQMDSHGSQTSCYFNDPHFMSLNPFDYHLDDSSPCIDSGLAILVLDDIDGEPRPLYNGFDIGADEFWSSDYTPQPTITPTITPTTTPPPTGTPAPPTSSPTPVPPMLYELLMPDSELVSGDILDLSVHRFNYGVPVNVDEFVALEVAGYLYFWPEWSSRISGEFDKTIPSGDSTQTILYIQWPNVSGSMSGLHFFAALFDAGHYDLIGFDAILFSYSGS